MRKEFRTIMAVLLIVIPGTVSAETFFRNLHFGMRDDPDVVRMQDFLRGQGYFSYPVSTGNYGPVTLGAVKRFQQANGILPIGGYFGPESRRAANDILAAKARSAQLSKAKDQQVKSPNNANLIPIPFLLENPTINPNALTLLKGSTPLQAPSSSFDSPYKGKIVITGVQWFGAADFQSIVVSNRASNERISVTGFTIETTHGQRYVIPVGFALPGLSPIPGDPIVLRPSDYAYVSVGRQDRQMNFRQNLCTGYFDETSVFSPPLMHRCLTPDVRSLRDLSQACANAIRATPACRVGAAPQFTEPECSVYIAKNLHYVGCVENYRNRTDFYSDTWLVWMQRKEPFFHQRFDTVTLKDGQGRVVDVFDYVQSF